MLHQTDGLSLQSPLRLLTVLVFHLLLTHCGGQSQVIGPPQPIAAAVGGDIILPCHLNPAMDLTTGMLEWRRSDLKPTLVYVCHAGQDLENVKDPSYKGRTSVFISELKHGNVSLKLSKVQLSDQGTYECYIPFLDKQASVKLVVASGAASSVFITLAGIDEATGGVMLDCESKGWYPEPEVLWLDAEGNLLSAGPTETVRGPDDLYTVSSRLTVEKRHSNNFTCRVQQKDINQTRETQIHVPDNFFTDSSSSSSSLSAPTIIGLVVAVMFILAVAFVVWKWTQNKIKTEKGMDEEAQTGKEEKRNSKSNDSEQEKLIGREAKKVEEENNIRPLSEETGLSEPENLRTGKETNNIFTQGETDVEKQSVNAGPGSQFVIENERQKHEVQTGGQTVNDSDTREAPGPAETETHQETPQRNVDERNGKEETSLDTGTEDQSVKDGDGQQQQGTEKTTNTDSDEEDEQKIKSANNEPAGQSPTEGGTQLNNETKTRNGLDQTGGETVNDSDTREAPGPAERETHQETPQRNVDERNGKEETSLDTGTEDQSVKDGNGQQQQAIVEGREKKAQTTNNKPAVKGPTEGDTQQNETQAGRLRENKSDQPEGQTGRRLTSEDATCPAGGEGKQENNRDGGGNTSPRSVDGLTDPLQAGEVQGDSDKNDEDEKTKSTNMEPAAQGDTNMMSKITEQQSPDRRDGEDEHTKTDKPPEAEVKTDVDDEKEEENKGEGDGEQDTTSVNNKTEHLAQVNDDTKAEQHMAAGDTRHDVGKGQTENESPTGTEETGAEGKGKKNNRKRTKKSGRNQDVAGGEEGNDLNKAGDDVK